MMDHKKNHSTLKSVKISNFLMAALIAAPIALASCSSNNEQQQNTVNTVSPSTGTPSAPTEPSALSGKMTSSKGIGPISSISIPSTIDDAMEDEGEKIFKLKCTACHNPTDQKKVGPGLLGVTHRRQPEWIMNMALNPTEMTQQDPVAKELLATYIAQMANQNLTQDEARKVLEYLRKNDKENFKG